MSDKPVMPSFAEGMEGDYFIYEGWCRKYGIEPVGMSEGFYQHWTEKAGMPWTQVLRLFKKGAV